MDVLIIHGKNMENVIWLIIHHRLNMILIKYPEQEIVSIKQLIMIQRNTVGLLTKNLKLKTIQVYKSIVCIVLLFILKSLQPMALVLKTAK